ncbi:prephenate dehydrogenase/arogenate dehydrogenase family protein [Actinomycetaceae bacterium TAE3-ERU4]|nr:prephenate dehydrogenase/arogenate dehydrogenase family protein [Actinomycetaceae bacterium TAE3-ERU4]
MRAITQFLIDRKSGDVRSLSLALSTLVFSILVVKVQPLLTGLDPLLQILIAAVSLGGCAASFEWILQRIRTSRVRGQWVYKSSAGNWGLAAVKQVGFDLTYEVQLFASEAGVRAALAGEPVMTPELLGHTTSTFCEYEDEVLSVRYVVGRTSSQYSARDGFLDLVPHGANHDSLIGYWTSTLSGGHGELFFTRPKTLDNLCQETLEEAEDSSDRPTVHVVGLGLIGGSCALALKERGWRVVAHDTSQTALLQAKQAGIMTDGEIGDQDIVILAAPTPVVVDYISSGYANNARLVVDVCSVKAPIVKALEASSLHNFISLHPMSGSEKSGFENAHADLLNEAVWALCVPEQTSPELADLAMSFAQENFQAQVCICSFEAHDRAVAVISHLSHALALALLARPGRSPFPELATRLAAGSYRDGTRVARGSAERIGDMLCENHSALAKVLTACLTDLKELSSYLEAGDEEAVRAWIDSAQSDWTPLNGEEKQSPRPRTKQNLEKAQKLGNRGWVTSRINGNEIYWKR